MSIPASHELNPYASPALQPESIVAAVAPAKPGSVAVVLGGFVLILLGYFTSNLFMIGDLYDLGMGPGGKPIASPFAAIADSALERWLLYALFSSSFIAGAIMVGSQRFNPMTVVCYVMCPLVGLIYLVASPLRLARKYAEPIAALYLMIGACLAFTGITKLFLLYGQPTNGFMPILASLMTQAGAGFVLGAAIKYSRIAPASSGAA